ncbi:polysaccharide deacetylase family protein [Chryseobacterium arthrosphaerae]|uniref:polysaccharide deacetylase family protein n=1 Tax=Chryseobacterium arthrosphaerae TaxID=651561 RepID=UPI0023E2AFBA|nr:polysaccharide deacetylase family protein [Chryseobacterium arthrosphaerae]WET00144.1 polysaccharide deacetylase family protein [Chryseobacterium arthrosphaerae]
MRTENALKYTIDTILTIALGYKIEFSVIKLSEDNIEIILENKNIIFRICGDEEFQRLLTGNLKLSDIPSFDDHYYIPVFKMRENSTLYNTENGKIIVNFDLLSLSFILLSNLDEFLSEERDQHDRFLYKNSIAEKYNIIKIPLVDEYAMLLRTILNKEYPDIEIKPRQFSITPTHDIDDIYRFVSPVQSVKSILSQLVRSKNIKEVVLAVKFFLQSLSNKCKDPYFKGIETLLKDSEANGLKSIFFFMGAKPSAYDAGHDVCDQNLKMILKKIGESGMVAGIHPGFYTYKDETVLRMELERVRDAVGHPIIHSRQHYLRFDRKQTFDNLQAAGIEIDYTMGFAEEEGFKCGTSHEFHPYDFKNDMPYKIKEKPLIAMDVTLSSYKKYSVSEAKKSLDILSQRIQRIGGDFIILWHNAYIYREVDFYKKVYLKFLNENQK